MVRAADHQESLSFEGTTLGVAIGGALPVARALAAIAPSWRQTLSMRSPQGREAVIEPEGDTFQFHSARGKKPIRGLGAAGAACGAIADVISRWLDERPGVLGLHCGAVEIRGRVIALTGTYRTGKSTLVARLTAEADLTVFCDDVLPILSDGRAMAFGIAPRLRLPLHESATAAFRAHVEAHTVSADRRYAYVHTPNLAQHGTTGTLGGIVVLTRNESGPASLHRIDRAEAVQQLIRQNIADPGHPLDHIDRVSHMAASMPCLRLVYSDLEDAVALLRAAFDADDVPSPQVAIQHPLPASLANARRLAPLDRVYRRDEETGVRLVGSDSFLWQPLGRNYFHLNPVAQAVWTLLETPQSGEAMAAVLCEAFPETDPRTVRTDLAGLLGQLEDRGLVFFDAEI